MVYKVGSWLHLFDAAYQGQLLVQGRLSITQFIQIRLFHLHNACAMHFQHLVRLVHRYGSVQLNIGSKLELGSTTVH